MNIVLLDTNIVSYLFKRDSRAALYEPHLENRELAVSLMTIAELFQWAALRDWGVVRVQRLEAHMRRYTILPIDVDTCRQWADVRASRSKAGLPISPQDAWIAATGLRYHLPLVTHNPDDYQAIPGLIIISEA
jgi:predicted nucleic acid-binding protein